MRKLILSILAVLLFSGFVNAQCTVSLGADTSSCDSSIKLTPELAVAFFEDSLRITYDASMGVSGLSGAAKVYMHSGLETTPFAGWEFTTGNWGLDDSLGLMTNIGGDIWQITIEPYSWYGVPNTTPLNGIFMVFRNADGTLTGKDDIDADIFLDLNFDPPTSSFGGISAEWIRDGIDSLAWSTGETSECIFTDTSGTFWISVTDTSGCTIVDTIEVIISPLGVDLGPDTLLCASEFPYLLDAGPGFTVYLWSVGGLGQTKSISDPDTVSIFVQNAAGCITVDTIVITRSDFSVDLGADTFSCDTSIVLEPAVSLEMNGDSLRITYNASMGGERLGKLSQGLYAFCI